jgi:hypothetical protein
VTVEAAITRALPGAGSPRRSYPGDLERQPDARESGVVVRDENPAGLQLEVYDTKTGLWHPELGDLIQPDSWDFLPAGDAFLTRRVKAAGGYWVVFQPRGRRAHRRLLGLLAPTEAISAARAAANATAAQRETQRAAGARQRDRSEAAYRAEFEQAVLQWLDFAPEHETVASDIAANAVERAAVVGSGRVGRTKTLGLDERAALAARAYIRHQYTDYEQRLERLAVANFDIEDEADIDIDSIGDYREIKREAHRAVDNFLELRRSPQA